VLFGSTARNEAGRARSRWSDLDLHVVTNSSRDFHTIDWRVAFPDESYCFQATRPATGGVHKLTLIFRAAQIDFVIIPVALMMQGAEALRNGSYRQSKEMQIALNEMATCLHTGYRFLKGEDKWGAVYSEVKNLPGVHLSDGEVREYGDIFLCDLLWVFQKIERGETVAAQHVLHTKLSDTNLRLWRERQRRRRAPLPSFGLGRGLEILASPAEVAQLRVAARPTASELRKAARKSFDALSNLMKDLAPAWSIPTPMAGVLRSHLK
jgi:hypothetical protein